MWTIKYRNYYIHGSFVADDCVAVCSPTGFGYMWRHPAKSLHAAKCAITKHINASK